MKDLFPSNPQADKQALLQMANAPTQEVAPQKNYINESVNVPQGSMPLGIDNVSDFAKLAGVITEGTQKTGSAGQAKGSDPMPKTSKPSSTGEQPHPLKDKLVGEDDIDLKGLTPGVTALGGALDPDEDFSALIARGLKKAADGIVLNGEEREAVRPYIELLTVIINTPQLRNNLISMQKSLERKRQSREEPQTIDDNDEAEKDSGMGESDALLDPLKGAYGELFGKQPKEEAPEKIALDQAMEKYKNNPKGLKAWLMKNRNILVWLNTSGSQMMDIVKQRIRETTTAGRQGASEEELGAIKDKYKKTESIKERLYRELNKRR